jgi:hypothetical protein
MTNQEFKDNFEKSKAEIKAIWAKVFPDSLLTVSLYTMGEPSIGIRGFIAKDSNESTNRILDNDPLNYIAWIDLNGYREQSLSIQTKPTEKFMYCDFLKLRKKTIKKFDYVKLEARFNEIKQFILANESLWHDTNKELLNKKFK